MTEEIKVKMRDYGIKAVPTTVIDGNIKVVGIP
jgi:predicted DsbA family dithiol-disulfide isomerase